MTRADSQIGNAVADVLNPEGSADIVLICEHASRFIPAEFNDLGLAADARESHIAWDPGALAVAENMAQQLDAKLVVSRVSRLVYDCNRPPEAKDAIPAKSEIFDVPGNTDLSDAQRNRRIETYYFPFYNMLSETLHATKTKAIVTLHSFTPVYFGISRDVEIGLLHDTDSRLADAMLELSAKYCAQDVRRNAPYGPQDGVTHTLKEHALPAGLLNVMIEIRNDLISTPQAQSDMGQTLSNWIEAALAHCGQNACQA